MSGLVEFLLARIAEDEEDARAATEIGGCWRMTADVRGGLIVDRSRALAECRTKRRIVRAYETARDAEIGDIAAAVRDEQAFRYVIRLLALTYCDDPDYREEWRP